ncbi:uroporphyrinogen decarboxylase family protein [uncultured Cohaesibacter sp.]|uniref:uroporphyrinogen decarboxylase family protein n=1 Tax=uncultured Cohaesibacter sp. TaxID=1002546 RepID=UPI00292DBF2A|nr:uroporphyrinogen decarboxylase family protein [uncultured Cohaesibacter sp.]
MNITEWKTSLIDAPGVSAIPVMTYPGMELTGATLMEVVTSGKTQARVIKTLADRYQTAAAVTMMDLSVEAEAFGAEIVFSEEEVPNAIGSLVTDIQSAEALAVPAVDAKRLGEYLLGMEETAKAITDRPVFGGVIGPFSLAGRLLDINKTLLATRKDPEMVHATLKKANMFLKDYLQAIKKTGVDGVVIAEPLAGLISPKAAKSFAMDYVKELVDLVQDDTFAVLLHNCGNATKQIPSMLETGSAMLHLGNSVKMTDIAVQMPDDVLFSGNVDPAAIFRIGTPEMVADATRQLLEDMKPYKNFVLSSGCDIPPGTPIANIDAFFEVLSGYNKAL